MYDLGRNLVVLNDGRARTKAPRGMQAVGEARAAGRQAASDVMLCYRMHYSAGGESGNLRQYPSIRRIGRLLSRRQAIKQDTRHSITNLNLNKSFQMLKSPFYYSIFTSRYFLIFDIEEMG